jgi:hypothetical protein
MAEYLKTSVEYLIIGKETDNTPVIKELKKQLDMFQKNIDKLV